MFQACRWVLRYNTLLGGSIQFCGTSFIHRSNHMSDLRRNEKNNLFIYLFHFGVKCWGGGAFNKMLTILTDGSGYFENTANDILTATVRDPTEEFQNSSRPVLFLRLIWRILQRNVYLPEKPPMSSHVAKNSASWSKTAVLTIICEGIGSFSGKRMFLRRKHQIRRRTRTGRGEFLKFLRGAAHCGRQHRGSTCRLPKHWSPSRKKGGCFWVSPQNYDLI